MPNNLLSITAKNQVLSLSEKTAGRFRSISNLSSLELLADLEI